MSFRLLDERDIVTLNKNYSNALTGNLKGEVARADDVSPLEHNVGVNVKSKNMIPLPYYHGNNITQQGVVITVDEEGVITFNGTALADSAFRLIQKASIPVKGKYTLSGCSGGSNTTYYLQPFIDEKGVATLFDGKKTYEWDGVLTSLAFFFKAGTTFENVQFKPQLEEGETATEYTPYVDPATVKVAKCGKNIVKYPYAEGEITRAGITYSVNENGEIVANGTSAGSYFNVITTASQKLYLHKGVTYHLSGVPKKTGLYYAYVKDASGTNYFDYGEGASFVPSVSGYGAVTIVVTENSAVENIVIKPQIEVGNTATEAELYKGDTYTPEADGTVEITSTSPVMTLYTEKEGAIIECEYNRDANAVIEKLFNAIIALGGTV